MASLKTFSGDKEVVPTYLTFKENWGYILLII